MSDLLRPLTPDTSVVLVVDMQERLLPAMHESDACLVVVRKCVRAARILGVPMLLTEQYPAGLGPTAAPLLDVLGDIRPVEKMRFSACVEPISQRLRELARPSVIVVGIEAHVCVQQTVLDLLRMGYMPVVCADGISSRTALDRDVALARMRQAGAIVTTMESVIFELLGEAGGDRFKQILKIVK